jgi:hypothetical protein
MNASLLTIMPAACSSTSGPSDPKSDAAKNAVDRSVSRTSRQRLLVAR